jgi:hypothetical protein
MQSKIVKTISSHTKGTDLIIRTLKKYISRDPIPLKSVRGMQQGINLHVLLRFDFRIGVISKTHVLSSGKNEIAMLLQTLLIFRKSV